MLPSSWYKADHGPAYVVAMLSWLPCITDGRVWLHWSISPSDSQTVLRSSSSSKIF